MKLTKTIHKHFYITKIISKSTILKAKYFLLALLVAFTFSCSTEDGKDGEQGPQGEQGIAGIDGNANVQTITFDASSFSGSFSSVSIPQLTQDVLQNDVVISYLTDSDNYWVPIPCPYESIGFDFAVHVILYEGGLDLDYLDASNSTYSISAGDLQSLKVVIIESTSTTTGKNTNGKQQIYNELAQAGIDIKDYYAVCDYYGIAY
ncbi:hypothetical protein [Lacinutrix sp. MedPE-SW]|uniref:hypothetical protein n=1 Tax=Lacinutrix sp. MedPE-SW TaxID=1860087 RepID=UPI00091C2567|nr:hypothetical protein [Lacinutrix sp. MedPE-SW]OIQ21273.1 MAG: hypothetical protein BM549_09880 [Lacinutrix sp. MedPE-SW]